MHTKALELPRKKKKNIKIGNKKKRAGGGEEEKENLFAFQNKRDNRMWYI